MESLNTVDDLESLKDNGEDSECTDSVTEWQNFTSLYDNFVKPLDSDDAQGASPTSESCCGDAGRNEIIGIWKHAARCAKKLEDPWATYDFANLPLCRAKRYVYSPLTEKWSENNVYIKIHPEVFARGAMREAYRLKKLPSFGGQDNSSPAYNYVAKKYVYPVERKVIFDDVKLQMDCKLWAEEFNRHNPPKKIDICQVSVLEMEDGQLYHLEHYIEGDYVKYNSNSGYVASEIGRQTPQAFSHFTFERSAHQLLVVDIQGVGDLYTDPQIHTATGEGYGSGNLGTKGMALFFHSHQCNDICASMCLTEFDLSPGELVRLNKSIDPSNKWSSSTRSLCGRQPSVCSSLVDDNDNAMEQLRRRTVSMNSSGRRSSIESISAQGSVLLCESAHDINIAQVEKALSPQSDKVTRFRSGSTCSSVLGDGCHEEDSLKEAFWREKRRQSRPAGIGNRDAELLCNLLFRPKHMYSILGQIHLDLARYYEMGRFATTQSPCSGKENFLTSENSVVYDKNDAYFHLEMAERCEIVEAIITKAQIAYGLPHELLKDVEFGDVCIEDLEEEETDREAIGFDLMKRAAALGDQLAVTFVADAYYTGRNMGKFANPSWTGAVHWYEKALDTHDEENGAEKTRDSDRAKFDLLQRIADMYREGGFGLEQDLQKASDLYMQAAGEATLAMHGRLATKLYALAEQCTVTND